MIESNLWFKIKNGDKKTFEIFFKKEYRTLVSYVNQLTNDIDLSEDIVQQSFVDLWEKREVIRITISLKSFLFKMAHNKFIDGTRKTNKNRLLIDSLRYNYLQLDLNSNNDFRKAKIEQISKLINQLPEKCKEIILLSKKENLKNREIAEKLKISIKTVENQISIAYKKIRKGYKY